MAPFAGIQVRSFLCIVVSLVLLSCTLFLSAGQISAAGRLLSEEDLLSVLPKGSVIATIPVRYAENGGVAERRKAIVQVSGLMGGDGEVLVGYYTEPDPPKGKELPESFYRRTHVAVIGMTEGKPGVLWDSGGWGFDFGMQNVGKPFSAEQVGLLFGARDWNGDKKPEVFFSRMSFNAEGTSFEMWSYSAKKAGMQQVCAIDGCVELVNAPHLGWPAIQSESFYASVEYHSMYQYDEKSERYICTKSTTKSEDKP